MNARVSFPQPLLWGFLAATLSAAGCDDSLKSVSLIEEPRVLGASVEVESDTTRSSPQPGERATLRLFIAGPSEPVSASYALSVCAVSPVNTGFPTCSGAPFASAMQVEPVTSAPTLAFRVPADLDLAATPHAFASALFCPESALVAAENGLAHCVDGAGTEVNFEFDLGGPEDGNHSPSITEDALSLDGQPWLSTEAAFSCPGELPAVSGGSRHTLTVTLQASNFETLPQTTNIEPARESLLASQFSTAGKLSHAFISLDVGTPLSDRQVTWQAPVSTGNMPTLVRFYFVVRDARGGEAFAMRALCVNP